MSDFDSSLFRINIPTPPPQAGSLLVAEPFLREEHFNHAVIKLVEHTPGKSSMGIVLNKPTGYTLGDAVEGFDDEVEIPIYCGGPVACDRLFYLHSLDNEIPGGREVSPGLFLGGDFERVKAYVNMGFPTENAIRFFVGYSGWDPGQLNEEIDSHVWAVAPDITNKELLAETGESFWYRIVRSMGTPYRNWLFHPVNPQLN